MGQTPGHLPIAPTGCTGTEQINGHLAFPTEHELLPTAEQKRNSEGPWGPTKPCSPCVVKEFTLRVFEGDKGVMVFTSSPRETSLILGAFHLRSLITGSRLTWGTPWNQDHLLRSLCCPVSLRVLGEGAAVTRTEQIFLTLRCWLEGSEEGHTPLGGHQPGLALGPTVLS